MSKRVVSFSLIFPELILNTDIFLMLIVLFDSYFNICNFSVHFYLPKLILCISGEADTVIKRTFS